MSAAYVLAVEPAAGGGADHGHAVRHRLLERGELLPSVENVGGVHRHALALVPRVLEVGGGEDELVEAHVGHGAAGAADVAGVERADEHDLDVVEGGHCRYSFVRGPSESRGPDESCPKPCGVDELRMEGCFCWLFGLRTLAQSVPW